MKTQFVSVKELDIPWFFRELRPIYHSVKNNKADPNYIIAEPGVHEWDDIMYLLDTSYCRMVADGLNPDICLCDYKTFNIACSRFAEYYQSNFLKKSGGIEYLSLLFPLGEVPLYPDRYLSTVFSSTGEIYLFDTKRFQEVEGTQIDTTDFNCSSLQGGVFGIGVGMRNDLPSVDIRKKRDCTGEFPCAFCNPDIHNKKFNCTNQYTLEWDITKGRLKSADCEEHITNEEVHNLVKEHDTQIIIECPICKQKQRVNLIDYAVHQVYGGHPYTCGTDTCPSHTELQVRKEMNGMPIFDQEDVNEI